MLTRLWLRPSYIAIKLMSFNPPPALRLYPDMWGVVASYMPVGGPDGQWRMQQLSRRITLPDAMNRQRVAWRDMEQRFHQRLEKPLDEESKPFMGTTGKWSAGQKHILRALSGLAHRLFRPETNMLAMQPLAVIIYTALPRRFGTTSAFRAFLYWLARSSREHVRIDCLCSGIRSTRETDDAVDHPRVTCISARAFDPDLPSPYPYADCLLSEHVDWVAPMECCPSHLLRPGGVAIFLTLLSRDEFGQRMPWEPPAGSRELSILFDAHGGGHNSGGSIATFEHHADGDVVLLAQDYTPEHGQDYERGGEARG